MHCVTAPWSEVELRIYSLFKRSATFCFGNCKWMSGQRHKWFESCCKQTFPMILGDTASATCAEISSLDAVRAAAAARTMRQSSRMSVQRGRPEPGLRVWECATGHYGKQRHIMPNMCRNSSICPSSFPQDYSVIPFKWLKLFNRSTYSLASNIIPLTVRCKHSRATPRCRVSSSCY